MLPAMKQTHRVVVVLVNGNVDMTELLREALDVAGFAATCATPEQLREGNLAVVTGENPPRVVLYDIASPYDEHWRAFETVASSPACAGLTFLVTTTNLTELAPVTTGDYAAYELGGSRNDLKVLLGAVRDAVHSSQVAAD
jgi:hypothetical protein